MASPSEAMVVSITGLAAGGDGIARLPVGKVVFCVGGLPGERVAIGLTEERKDFARAVVVDVLDASPARRQPPCPHVARGCGGCTWQHVAPEHQPGLKVGIVEDALRRLAHLPDVPVLDQAGRRIPERAYRTGLRLAVDGAGRPSYRRRRSSENVTVDSCLVAHPALAELVTAARFPGASEVGFRVGAHTGERMAWAAPGEAQALVPPGTRLGPDAAIHEIVAGRRWRVSAGAFFQSGPLAAEALVAAVLAAVGSVTGPVVDLYAGGGLLGGSIVAATGGGPLIAVESHPAAVRDARINLADLDARIEHTDVASFRGASAGVVVADPARTGLGPSAARVAASLRAPVLVLVSCDPASLARDARILATLGYDLERVEVVDVFPDTFHTETVSRFTVVGAAESDR